MLAQGQSSSAKRGGLAADVSSGLIFLKGTKKKLPKHFPEWLYHFTFPSLIYERSTFSPSLPASSIVTIFYFSHFDRCVVLYLIVVLICIFLMANEVECLLMSLLAHSLWWNVCSSFAHLQIGLTVFYCWILRVFKYNLNTCPLSDTWVCKYFLLLGSLPFHPF